jgi:hypothetical protein
MSLNCYRSKLRAFVLSAIFLASGCFNQSQSGFSGLDNGSLQARPQGGFGPVGRGGPGGPPGLVNLAGYNPLAEYQATDLSQKLEELRDENRSLLARLQGVQGLLEERERAVLLSRGEVQAATQEVAHARQEVTRCRQEIAGLRERIRAADKENQDSMQSLVKMLESMLDRGRPPAEAPSNAKEPAKDAADKEKEPAAKTTETK